MGLLASGAAHELGTPLASLAVIINDWRRMPALTANPALLEEIDEMQTAIARCKTIVSGILAAAGEARGEHPSVTTVHAFFDGVVADWRAQHGEDALDYENRFGDDIAIVSDTALGQVIRNVLDNALEACGQPVWLQVRRENTALALDIRDHGPGFSDDMLSNFGQPYRSTKARQGGGLGLFLVVNAMRKLGGTVSAANHPAGGAVISLRLPLATLQWSAR